jgi:hypothetical protein
VTKFKREKKIGGGLKQIEREFQFYELFKIK